MEKPQKNLLKKLFLEHSNYILILDIDGTLAPFKKERQNVNLWPGIREILEQIISAEKSEVIFVTGRKASEAEKILNLKNKPKIWGEHGWEVLNKNGSLKKHPFDKTKKELLEQIFLTAQRNVPKECLEKKYSGIAIHWRGLTQKEKDAINKWLENQGLPLVEKAGFEKMPFDGGLEIRVPGRDKGVVVREIVNSSPKNSLFAYLGDDMTDEKAFVELPEDGISVLVRKDPRKTKAKFWICPPQELIEFLKIWKECLKFE